MECCDPSGACGVTHEALCSCTSCPSTADEGLLHHRQGTLLVILNYFPVTLFTHTNASMSSR